MFGILLTAFSSSLEEIGSTIGKRKMRDGSASLYSIGFLNLLGGAIFLGIIGLVRDSFVFSLASLPTFIPRLILEIILVHITIRALAKADRSTFGFIRTGTIPLLLLTDVVLGYSITFNQLSGILIAALGLLFMFMNHGIRSEGALLTALSAIGAAATITLYKYNITYFNSVEAEQLIVLLVLLVQFFVCAVVLKGENPFALLRKRAFFTEAAVMGIGQVGLSFAFLLAPASIITTAKRSLEVLAGIISGHRHFKEQRPVIKIIGLAIITVGLYLIVR